MATRIRKKSSPEVLRRKYRKRKVSGLERAKRRRRVARHPEVARAKRRKNRLRQKELHPEVFRLRGSLHQHRRRARKAGNGGSFSVADWIVLCWASAWRCAYCGTILDETTVVKEHRVPLARGGTNDVSNIALSCASCNTRKGVKTDVEFLVEKSS